MIFIMLFQHSWKLYTNTCTGLLYCIYINLLYVQVDAYKFITYFLDNKIKKGIWWCFFFFFLFGFTFCVGKFLKGDQQEFIFVNIVCFSSILVSEFVTKLIREGKPNFRVWLNLEKESIWCIIQALYICGLAIRHGELTKSRTFFVFFHRDGLFLNYTLFSFCHLFVFFNSFWWLDHIIFRTKNNFCCHSQFFCFFTRIDSHYNSTNSFSLVRISNHHLKNLFFFSPNDFFLLLFRFFFFQRQTKKKFCRDFFIFFFAVERRHWYMCLCVSNANQHPHKSLLQWNNNWHLYKTWEQTNTKRKKKKTNTHVVIARLQFIRTEN